VDARLRAPSDPLAAFLFISESGDLIDQLIGERSLRLIAILSVQPALALAAASSWPIQARKAL